MYLSFRESVIITVFKKQVVLRVNRMMYKTHLKLFKLRKLKLRIIT